MKKEGMKDPGNSVGLVGFIFGTLSVVLFSVLSLPLGVLGIIFSIYQNKRAPNSWSKWGLVLSIIGIILGVIAAIALVKQFNYLMNNPQLLRQIQDVGQAGS